MSHIIYYYYRGIVAIRGDGNFPKLICAHQSEQEDNVVYSAIISTHYFVLIPPDAHDDIPELPEDPALEGLRQKSVTISFVPRKATSTSPESTLSLILKI